MKPDVPYVPHKIDAQILALIDRLRAEHHCCSPGMVALGLKVSKNHVVTRCDAMKRAGIVNWSNGMGGSLHRVGTREYIEERLPLDGAPVPAEPAQSVATVCAAITEATATVDAVHEVVKDARSALAELRQFPPLAAEEIIIEGKPVHVDHDALAEALARAKAIQRPARREVTPKKSSAPTKRKPPKSKTPRAKKERTPAQIAATERMRQARADSIAQAVDDIAS